MRVLLIHTPRQTTNTNQSTVCGWGVDVRKICWLKGGRIRKKKILLSEGRKKVKVIATIVSQCVCGFVVVVGLVEIRTESETP